MKLGADPLATYAVLVGVETYVGGDRWTLDGPAINALRMAQWLLAQQVPPGHIQLYVNFGESRTDEGRKTQLELRQLMEQHGIAIRAPTRASLEAALNPALLSVPPSLNATLLVYLSGHGLSSEVKRKRYALTADASDATHDAIDIEYQAANLRLNPLARRYATQWIIQDACAQTVTREMRPAALSSDVPETPQGTRQYCLYATRPGEFALTEGSRAGEFTRQLLDVLNDAGPLCELDLKSIYSKLESRFMQLDQHPTLYSHDENWAEASLAPGKSKSDSEATAALVELVGQMDISVPMIRAVFQDVARSEDVPPAAIEDMLRMLGSLVMDEATGLCAVERFAIRLESYCLRYAKCEASALDEKERKNYAHAARLTTRWIDKWAKKRARAAVNQERDRLDDAAQIAQKSPVIILELKGDAAEARAWRYAGGAPIEGCILDVASTALAGQVAELLGKLGEKQWLLGETVIELVLPLDVVLQHFAGIKVVVDARYGVTYSLGGRQLLLVVRVAERWSDRSWHTRWTDYWRETAHFRRGKPQIAWLNSGANTDRTAWYWLGASDIESGELTVALRKALYEGLPFAAWCASAHTAQVQSALTGHTYADIIKLLQDVGTLNGQGRRLTCLVDDPSRIPPGASVANSRLRQPTMRANS